MNGRRHLVGEKLTVADISARAYLIFEGDLGADWGEYPGIDERLARIRAEPRRKHPYDLLPGHPLPERAQAAR
ncbi:MAG TPA: hypothetical protein VJO54_02055 [Burkholderiales bacterium]|nr:hypothetical protein [Burkholderiales bacterium]